MIALRPRAAFPLAISALAFLFLGLFLIYPVFSVFAVSFLDKAGHLTADNYVRILGRSFYQQSLWNSLTIGALATLATTVKSSSQLTVTIHSSMIPAPGSFNITVQTPAGNTGSLGCSSGGTSSVRILTVN